MARSTSEIYAELKDLETQIRAADQHSRQAYRAAEATLRRTGRDPGYSEYLENFRYAQSAAARVQELYGKRDALRAEMEEAKTAQRAARAARQEDMARRQQSGASDRPPVTRTYELTPSQLYNGCTIQHVFQNGATKSVEVYPNTRSGQVIVVRPSGRGAAEAIRITAG